MPFREIATFGAMAVSNCAAVTCCCVSTRDDSGDVAIWSYMPLAWKPRFVETACPHHCFDARPTNTQVEQRAGEQGRRNINGSPRYAAATIAKKPPRSNPDAPAIADNIAPGVRFRKRAAAINRWSDANTIKPLLAWL